MVLTVSVSAPPSCWERQPLIQPRQKAWSQLSSPNLRSAAVGFSSTRSRHTEHSTAWLYLKLASLSCRALHSLVCSSRASWLWGCSMCRPQICMTLLNVAMGQITVFCWRPPWWFLRCSIRRHDSGEMYSMGEGRLLAKGASNNCSNWQDRLHGCLWAYATQISHAPCMLSLTSTSLYRNDRFHDMGLKPTPQLHSWHVMQMPASQTETHSMTSCHIHTA